MQAENTSDTDGDGRATQARVEMYSSMLCPFCAMAKRLLASKDVDYEHIGVDGRPGKRREMIERSGRHTVPQVFIDGQPVGGYDDIAALDAAGGLDGLLRPGLE